MFEKFFGTCKSAISNTFKKVLNIPAFIKDIPAKLKFYYNFAKALFAVVLPDMIKSAGAGLAQFIATPVPATMVK